MHGVVWNNLAVDKSDLFRQSNENQTVKFVQEILTQSQLTPYLKFSLFCNSILSRYLSLFENRHASN